MVNTTRWQDVLQDDLEVYIFLYHEAHGQWPSVNHLMIMFKINNLTLGSAVERSEELNLFPDADIRDYRVRRIRRN